MFNRRGIRDGSVAIVLFRDGRKSIGKDERKDQTTRLDNNRSQSRTTTTFVQCGNVNLF